MNKSKTTTVIIPTFEDLVISKADEIYGAFLTRFNTPMTEDERLEIADTMANRWKERG